GKPGATEPRRAMIASTNRPATTTGSSSVKPAWAANLRICGVVIAVLRARGIAHVKVMPESLHSRRKAMQRAASPALALEYDAKWAKGMAPNTELAKSTWPEPLRFIAGSAARVKTAGATRLT